MKNGSTLRTENLVQMREMLKCMKRVVICFIPWNGNHSFAGEMIDELLDCGPDEKGFLVPEIYRNYLAEYRDGYTERAPGSKIDLRAIDCPFRFDLANWAKFR